MHRNKVFAAMLAVLMVVSLTACGRESVGTPGGELENGVAAIEDIHRCPLFFYGR